MDNPLRQNQQPPNMTTIERDRSQDQIDFKSTVNLNPIIKIKNAGITFNETLSTSCQDTMSIATTQAGSSSAAQNSMYFELKVKIKDGKNLAIRDIGGSSDPYIKFLLNGTTVYKSKIILKNLNPQWNEEFTIRLNLASISSNDPSFMSKLNSTFTNDNISLISASDICFSQDQLNFIMSKFKLKMVVYDYDRGFLNDDLIGYANIELTSLKENV